MLAQSNQVQNVFKNCKIYRVEFFALNKTLSNKNRIIYSLPVKLKMIMTASLLGLILSLYERLNRFQQESQSNFELFRGCAFQISLLNLLHFGWRLKVSMWSASFHGGLSFIISLSLGLIANNLTLKRLVFGICQNSSDFIFFVAKSLVSK